MLLRVFSVYQCTVRFSSGYAMVPRPWEAGKYEGKRLKSLALNAFRAIDPAKNAPTRLNFPSGGLHGMKPGFTGQLMLFLPGLRDCKPAQTISAKTKSSCVLMSMASSLER